MTPAKTCPRCLDTFRRYGHSPTRPGGRSWCVRCERSAWRARRQADPARYDGAREERYRKAREVGETGGRW